MGELVALFPHHWEETKREEPLDVNFSAYREMEKNGAIVLVTVREGLTLAGYWLCILSPFLHSRSLRAAYTDILYISPPFRTGGTFFSLQRKMEELLLQKGVSLWFVGEKLLCPIGAALKRMGFKSEEMIYLKKLGG